MKNVHYQTSSFADAQKKQKEIPDSIVDFYVSGSRSDQNGVVLEQRTYEVYTLVKEED